jgi:hypothetical protein
MGAGDQHSRLLRRMAVISRVLGALIRFVILIGTLLSNRFAIDFSFLISQSEDGQVTKVSERWHRSSFAIGKTYL